MEDNVFPSSAVAELMKEHLVESRLHTDSQNTLTLEQLMHNRELRDRIAGVQTNPYYVMVDPNTGDEVGRFELPLNWLTWTDSWKTWILQMAAKTGR